MGVKPPPSETEPDTGAPPATDDGGRPGSAADTADPAVDAPVAVVPDAGSGSDMAPALSARVLIYTRTTGQRHDSIPTAAAAISRAAKAAGLAPETSEDPAKFTTASLAVYGAIVLVATTGEPFGPGTTGVDALSAFVKGGGALVGIENATHAYDTNNTYVSLLGGDFIGHPGDYTTATCTKEGTHPSVAMLPASFRVTDEIYAFSKYRMDNQVVLRCADDHRPVSWYREEGAGRVFYTALGHSNESWTQPPLVDQHVLPGLLWALRR
jgi:type 1 glutamine amidotransferase